MAESTRAKSRSGSKTDSEESVSMISQDGLYTDGSLESLAERPTVVDATGIERVIGPRIDSGWKPAPIEPDPEEVARLEGVSAAFADARKTRLGLVADPSIHGETAEPLISANRAEHGGSTNDKEENA